VWLPPSAFLGDSCLSPVALLRSFFIRRYGIYCALTFVGSGVPDAVGTMTVFVAFMLGWCWCGRSWLLSSSLVIVVRHCCWSSVISLCRLAPFSLFMSSFVSIL
jgi:hypothetical protein